jgi:hypothetical protein
LTAAIVCAELDADMLALVKLADTQSAPDFCSDTTIATAAAVLAEEGTGRPLVADVYICDVVGTVDADLAVLLHEMMHTLVCASSA